MITALNLFSRYKVVHGCMCVCVRFAMLKMWLQRMWTLLCSFLFFFNRVFYSLKNRWELINENIGCLEHWGISAFVYSFLPFSFIFSSSSLSCNDYSQVLFIQTLNGIKFSLCFFLTTPNQALSFFLSKP